jgi:hypothetical protein
VQAPGGGVVARQLGVDGGVVEAAERGQALDEVPAQLGVDDEARAAPRAVEQRRDRRRVRVAPARARRRRARGSAAGRCRPAPPTPPAALASASASSRPAPSRAYSVAAVRPGQQGGDDGGVALAVDAVEDRPDEGRRRQLGVAAGVPQRCPAQGTRSGSASRRTSARTVASERLVEADLGEGQFAVVGQQQVGQGVDREGAELADDLDVEPLAQHERVAGAVVRPDADAVGAQDGGLLPDVRTVRLTTPAAC